MTNNSTCEVKRTKRRSFLQLHMLFVTSAHHSRAGCYVCKLVRFRRSSCIVCNKPLRSADSYEIDLRIAVSHSAMKAKETETPETAAVGCDSRVFECNERSERTEKLPTRMPNILRSSDYAMHTFSRSGNHSATFFTPRQLGV